MMNAHLPLAYLFVIVFFAASVAKVRRLSEFARYLGHGTWAAFSVITSELLLGVAWLVSAIVGQQHRLVAALTVGFLGAASLVVIRRTMTSGELECYCFGGPPEEQRAREHERISGAPARAARFVVRNVVLLSSASYIVTDQPLVYLLLPLIVPCAFAAATVKSLMIDRREQRRGVPRFVQSHLATMRALQAQDWWLDGHPREMS